MIKVNIKAESRYPVDRKLVRKVVFSVLDKHSIQAALVEIFLVGDRKMKNLNKKHLGKDKTTDVLSFPLLIKTKEPDEQFITPPKDILRLGEIVISYPQAQRQAMKNNKTMDEEINFLVEHGLLHLLGIHHD
jgi:probable rRNA maturation factor